MSLGQYVVHVLGLTLAGLTAIEQIDSLKGPTP